VRKFLPVIAVAAALGIAGKTNAQTYPSHAITMGMPFAAGGPGDTLARILAERMGVSLGQSVIVEADELGVPGLYVSLWNGLWAPKGVPTEIIGRLNAAVAEALADLPVRQRLADLGHDFFPRDQMTTETLAGYQKAEIEKWWPIIKAAGIRGE
jgi:tripartite-type tricarboxylate transporter receptor subunit TctC